MKLRKRVIRDVLKYVSNQDGFFNKHKDQITVIKGSELIGKEYIPPFDYYLDKDFKDKENAWKVYGADYVTTGEGTGIVHLAPAYGEEDLALAQEKNIPIVHRRFCRP